MNDSNYNALTALAKTHENPKVHRVPGKAIIQGSGEQAELVITLKVSDVAGARPGTGQRKSPGFSLGPVPFQDPDTGNTYELYANWVRLGVR